MSNDLPSGLFAVVKRTTKLSNASGKSAKYRFPSSARSVPLCLD